MIAKYTIKSDRVTKGAQMVPGALAGGETRQGLVAGTKGERSPGHGKR